MKKPEKLISGLSGVEYCKGANDKCDEWDAYNDYIVKGMTEDLWLRDDDVKKLLAKVELHKQEIEKERSKNREQGLFFAKENQEIQAKLDEKEKKIRDLAIQLRCKLDEKEEEVKSYDFAADLIQKKLDSLPTEEEINTLMSDLIWKNGRTLTQVAKAIHKRIKG